MSKIARSEFNIKNTNKHQLEVEMENRKDVIIKTLRDENTDLKILLAAYQNEFGLLKGRENLKSEFFEKALERLSYPQNSEKFHKSSKVVDRVVNL